MSNSIYRSAYTAAQIEAAIGKGPRVNASGYWEVWNVSTGAYESTGVGAGVKPPTVVTQASQMTNHGYIYIYNGTETGYTAGYWYYWNGSAWTAGGAYQVAATDPTLSVAGAAADAKACGDLKSAIKADELTQNNVIIYEGTRTIAGSASWPPRTFTKNLIKINGTFSANANNYYAQLDLPQQYATTESSVNNWNKNIPLVAEHIYKFTGMVLSGSVTIPDGETLTYKAKDSGNNIVLTCGYNESVMFKCQTTGNFLFYFHAQKNTSFADAVLAYTLVDITEIEEVKENFISMQDALLVTDAQALTWNQGTINGSTGAATSSGTRCYTDHVKVEHSAYALTIPSGYKCYIYKYTSPSASGYVGPYISDWQTGTVRINAAIGNYIRFVCAYTDDAAITPSDITGVALTYGDYTDQTLSMSGKAADSKVVGDKIGPAEKNAYDSILDLMAFCPNLFSVYSADYQPKKGYSGSTGSIVNATNNCISGYIRVSAGDYLQIFANKINVLNQWVDGQYRKLAYYDSNKTWVKTETYWTNTTGPDALRIETDGYIRVVFRMSDLQEIFVSTVRRDKLVDLIVFAGQSNMAGRGETSSTYPDTAPAVIPGAGYEFKSITDPTQLYPLTEPFGYAENAPDDTSGIDDGTKKTGDMVAAFVNAYYTNNGNVPVVCVSASEGGSSSSEWLPTTGNNFVDLSNRLTTARQWLADNGYSIRHQYCAWCQGESDGDNIANGSETFAEYESRARSIFNGLISLGFEKVLLVRIGHHNSGTSARYTAIIQWQTAEAQTNDALVMVSCDFAGMRSKGMMKDSFHYYQIGYNITGNSAGINAALYATTGKEPTMYDPESNNLYYSHKN